MDTPTVHPVIPPVITVQVWSKVARATDNRTLILRLIDLEMVYACNKLMYCSSARAFRMLFGIERKHGFAKDDESVEDKFKRIFIEMGITESDMNTFHTLIIEDSVETHNISRLWKFGIFLNAVENGDLTVSY
jgi:hypothetical protein